MSAENKTSLRRLTVEDSLGGTTIYSKVIDLDFLTASTIPLLMVVFVDTDGITKTAVQPMDRIFRYIVEPYREPAKKQGGADSDESNSN